MNRDFGLHVVHPFSLHFQLSYSWVLTLRYLVGGVVGQATSRPPFHVFIVDLGSLGLLCNVYVPCGLVVCPTSCDVAVPPEISVYYSSLIYLLLLKGYFATLYAP